MERPKKQKLISAISSKFRDEKCTERRRRIDSVQFNLPNSKINHFKWILFTSVDVEQQQLQRVSSNNYFLFVRYIMIKHWQFSIINFVVDFSCVLTTLDTTIATSRAGKYPENDEEEKREKSLPFAAFIYPTQWARITFYDVFSDL